MARDVAHHAYDGGVKPIGCEIDWPESGLWGRTVGAMEDWLHEREEGSIFSRDF